MNRSKYLVVIAGPTAVGKTKLCIDLAKYLDTEIVSADSRKFYREMVIGTAKPTIDEMGGVPHHFIDHLSVESSYDIGKYEKEALTTLGQIFENKNSAILTGGSGLYIDAVCKGFDEMPEIPGDIRNTLNALYEAKGVHHLAARLKLADSEYYNQADLKNPRRIIRALEVYQATGKPYSSFRKSVTKTRPFCIIRIGLGRSRRELYQRIDERMDIMIRRGLFGEAEKLYPYKLANALQTVGYIEIFGYLDRMYDKGEAIRLLKRNSRRYAKRQITWFGRDKETKWFHPEDESAIITYLKELIV